MATSAKPRLRPKGYTDYESLLRLHIRPCLGTRPLGAITQFDIQSLYAQMFNRGLLATLALAQPPADSEIREILANRIGPDNLGIGTVVAGGLRSDCPLAMTAARLEEILQNTDNLLIGRLHNAT